MEAVFVDTGYLTLVSSVSFEVLPAPTFVDNPSRDVSRSINQPTITAPAVTQISAPVMTSVVGGNLPVTAAENQPTSMPSINMPVPLSYPQISTVSMLNLYASSFVPKFQEHTESSTTHVLADLAEQLYISRTPVPEPPVFSGSPLEYAAWKSAFEILIENKCILPAENIH